MKSKFSEEADPDSAVLGRREFLSRMFWAAPAVMAGTSLPTLAQASAPIPADLSFLRGEVDLRIRSDWTSEAPRLQRLNTASAFTKLTVHHQGTGVNESLHCDEVVADIHNVLDGHFQRRFGDIGYHMVIDRAGRVWEGRELKFIGAHVAECNEGNIGVMLLGNFERQKPSDKQLISLRSVIEATRDQFAIPAQQVFGHRDLGQTLCPGRHLLNYVHLIQGATHQA